MGAANVCHDMKPEPHIGSVLLFSSADHRDE